MNIALSTFTQHVYRYVAKPILFRQKPDGVHARLLWSGQQVQKVAPLRALLRVSWAYKNEEALGQTLHGITFPNPIGLSAGFDKNFELVPLVKEIGFGFMEGGSITFHQCAGNPKPWFYRLPKTQSLVVNAGLANKGVSAVIKTLKRYPSRVFTDFPLNISVAKTNSPGAASEADAIADYVGSLTALQSARLGSMITLNISCPNTYGGEPFTTPERLDHLLTAIDALHLAQPVFIKMPVDLAWPEFKQLLNVADTHTVAGVTISNLAKDRSTVKLLDPLPDSVKGNLSGKPTQALSNQLISKTYQAYKDRFTIIGAGGVFSAEDAYEKIKLGANLVELITGLIFEGPQLIGQINRNLVKLLERDGYANVSEARGTKA